MRSARSTGIAPPRSWTASWRPTGCRSSTRLKEIPTRNVYEGMSGHPAVALAVDAASDDRGDRLADLFDAHEDRLYRLARRLAPSADAADDLVQETFLRAA